MGCRCGEGEEGGEDDGRGRGKDKEEEEDSSEVSWRRFFFSFYCLLQGGGKARTSLSARRSG